MDLHQLKVFHAAAGTGSFSRASENLHLSQSTVSQHIRQLEDELGCQLFLRVGKRVLLTEAGRVLVEHAEKIFTDVKNAQMAVREYGGLRRGHLRIGTGVTMLTYLLPPFLKTFKTKYPGVELLISTGTTAVTTELIRAHTLDLGIVTLPVSATDLQVRELLTEELLVAVGRDYPNPNKKIISARELAALPLILYEKQTVLRSLINELFRDLRITPNSIIELGNIEAIKSLIAEGLGASILPYNAVRREEREGRLLLLRVEGRRLHRRVGVVTLKSDYLPHPVREMIKLLIPKKPQKTDGDRRA